jgi:hypothetical protein
MPALTAALIGLALAGGVAGGTALAKANAPNPNSGQPTTAPPSTSLIQGPPTANSAGSSASLAATAAADRQKKRAAAGDTLLTGSAGTSSQPKSYGSGSAPAASLIGG